MSDIKSNLEKLKKAQENAAKLPVLSDSITAIKQRLTDAKFGDADWDSAIGHLEREITALKALKAQYFKMLEAEAHARLMKAEADSKSNPAGLSIPRFIRALYHMDDAKTAPAAAPSSATPLAAVFDADDLKLLESVTASSPITDAQKAALITKVEAFGKVMADESITAEVWAATIAADNYRLIHVLARCIATGIELGDTLTTEVLNHLAMLASIDTYAILVRIGQTPGFFHYFSAQFEQCVDNMLEMRLRFFMQLCLVTKPAESTTVVIPGAAVITTRLLDLLDHETQIFVDASAYSLLLLNVIDGGARTGLHTCNDHKNRQTLMEISYNLVIRALSDAKLEVSDDERTKLEWAALVWIEHVQINHSEYFYANDVRVLMDSLIRQSIDSGLVPMLPEYVKTIGALLRMGDQYPKEPTDDRVDYKIAGITKTLSSLADNAAHAKPQTDLVLDITRQIKLVQSVLADRAAKKAGSGGAVAATGGK